MSDEALDTKIASAWESAGLDVSNDGLDVPDSSDDDGDDAPPTVEDSSDDTSADTPDTPANTTPVEEESTEESAVDAVAETPEVPEQTEAQQEQQQAEDDLAAALGLGAPPTDPQKRKQWWKTRMPYSQVHKVVQEREKKLQEAHAAALQEHTGQLTKYETRIADVAKVENIISNNPEQYVTTLAQLFPETYGRIFAPLFQQDAQPLPEVQDQPLSMPEPDLDLGDGSKTYSLEGLKGFAQWVRDDTLREFNAQFRPHLDYVQQQKEYALQQAQAQERYQQGMQTAQGALEEVKTWDLGAENITEILTEAAKLDPRYDALTALSMAYRKVVVPKLKLSQDEMRAQILKDMKKASAKKTATQVTQTVRTKETPDESMLDLDTRIRNAWKRKGLV